MGQLRALVSRALLASATAIVAGCGPASSDEIGRADDPDDRLDEPCFFAEGASDPATTGPASSPMGLADSLTSSGKYRVWPSGRVPYEIASTVGSTTKQNVLDAMAEWQTKTEQRVRFEKATSSDTAYVLVTDGSPHVNLVGYKSGTVSKLYLRNPEYLTVTRHELGHVLGLEHEHQRKDRSGFILYQPEYIVDTTDCKNQFSVCSDCTLVGNYNIKSVMHYRSLRDLKNCRIDNQPVLLAKDGSLIDHEWVLTQGDLLAIAELYGAAPGEADAGTDSGAELDGGAGASAESGTAGEAGSSATGGTGGAGVGGAKATGGAGGSGGSKVKPGQDDASDSGCGCRTLPREKTNATGWWLWVIAAIAVYRGRSGRR